MVTESSPRIIPERTAHIEIIFEMVREVSFQMLSVLKQREAL